MYMYISHRDSALLRNFIYYSVIKTNFRSQLPLPLPGRGFLMTMRTKIWDRPGEESYSKNMTFRGQGQTGGPVNLVKEVVLWGITSTKSRHTSHHNCIWSRNPKQHPNSHPNPHPNLRRKHHKKTFQRQHDEVTFQFSIWRWTILMLMTCISRWAQLYVVCYCWFFFTSCIWLVVSNDFVDVVVRVNNFVTCSPYENTNYNVCCTCIHLFTHISYTYIHEWPVHLQTL